jgi:2-oxoglutarate dehydrogenase E1 component
MPTTPAQIFHLLRRQMLRPYRKPLIIMSPKSMLRNPMATSSIDELAEGEFQLLIPEVDKLDSTKVDRVVFCSGKVYYDLLGKRRSDKLNNIAIIRVEQLYPFAEKHCRQILEAYPNAKEIVWCQEEPQNMGAWITMQPCLANLLSKRQALRYAGRASSASPAVGYHSVHEKEQAKLVAEALQ